MRPTSATSNVFGAAGRSELFLAWRHRVMKAEKTTIEKDTSRARVHHPHVSCCVRRHGAVYSTMSRNAPFTVDWCRGTRRKKDRFGRMYETTGRAVVAHRTSSSAKNGDRQITGSRKVSRI